MDVEKFRQGESLMAKQVTMKDIAKSLNISTVSVSKALSDKDGVSMEVREKIKRRAEEMGYHYSQPGRVTEPHRSYNIGILIARRFVEDESAFYSKLYNNMIIKLSHQT